MDFSGNSMHEPSFEFFDQKLLDAARGSNKDVQEFFRLLALCHTVMPEEKDGEEVVKCILYVLFYVLKSSKLYVREQVEILPKAPWSKTLIYDLS